MATQLTIWYSVSIHQLFWIYFVVNFLFSQHSIGVHKMYLTLKSKLFFNLCECLISVIALISSTIVFGLVLLYDYSLTSAVTITFEKLCRS